MKNKFLLYAFIPVLFLVFSQNSFGQVKQPYGFYYTYDLRRSNDPAIEIRSMPFGLSNESEYDRKFFEDTLPCVKFLKESKVVEMYDSVYRFYGFMGDARQKHLDSMFITMCSPSARLTPGDSIKVIYINTKNPEVFNYDLRVGYYNGKVSRGLIYYQVKNSQLFGRYKIEGNNTTIEEDPFIVTVKEMVSYETIKRRLAKLVPVKPVVTDGLVYTQKQKGNKIVVILQDEEQAIVPTFDSVKYKDSVRVAFVRDSTQKRMAFVADSTKKAKDLIAKQMADAERRARVADSTRNAEEVALVLKKANAPSLPEIDKILSDTKALNASADSFHNSLVVSDAKNAKKRTDSILLARKKAREDSVANAKYLARHKKQSDDSLKNVRNKIRKDSVEVLTQIAKAEKKKVDSIFKEKLEAEKQLAFYKTRDSLLQRRKDSINNAKYLAYLKDSTDKSILFLANEKKRVDDSLAIAKTEAELKDRLYKVYLKRVRDSVDSVAFQRRSDSLDAINRRDDSIARAEDSVKNLIANTEFKLAQVKRERDSLNDVISVKNVPKNNEDRFVTNNVNVYKETQPQKMYARPIIDPEVYTVYTIVDSTGYDRNGRPVKYTRKVVKKK